VQERADVRGIAPARVLVVVGDERAQIRSVARLGRGFALVDQGADLVLGRARRAATGEDGDKDECESVFTQGGPPTAAGRP
jgi:hypothetical protein